MESLSPKIAVANASGGNRSWWAGYLPAVIGVLALVAVAVLGHSWGWGNAILALVSQAPAEVTDSPIAEDGIAAFDMEALRIEQGQLVQEIAQLREQRIALMQANGAYDNFAEEWEPYDITTARVVSRDPYKIVPSLIVDAGSRDGVRVGQPVLGHTGIIGRVTKVWPQVCTIDMIFSPNVAFGALVQTSRSLGVVQGDGANLRMDYVADSSLVESGDWVVTSGVPGITPAGLPLGIVESVLKETDSLTLQIAIEPLEDPWVLEAVNIVRANDQPLEATPLDAEPDEESP